MTTAAVGIDLGTAYSSVAVLEGGIPRVVHGPAGERRMPSVVGLSTAGTGFVIGSDAASLVTTQPRRVVQGAKRHLGADWSTKLPGRVLGAQQVSAWVLRTLADRASDYLGTRIVDIVVGVPACFNDAQRQAVREAADIAGLHIMRLINEPTAALLTTDVRADAERRVLVVDLGAGKFDASIVEVGSGVVEVRATSGSTRLGGLDWDERITDWLAQHLRDTCGLDPSIDALANARLGALVEQTRIALTAEAVVQVRPAVFDDENRNASVKDASLTRTSFEWMTSDLIDRCRAHLSGVAVDAGVALSQVDDVLILGGASRMPAFDAALRDLTGGITPHAFPDDALPGC